ncbi:MAG: MBL fold metallo-hydrolase [Candidatus Woesearchaeota archaeon]
MRYLEQITKNIWKLKADCNVYLLDNDEPIVIDTSKRANRELLVRWLSKVRAFEEIRHVVFTHLHYDHIGNFDLFSNARFYASESEIESFKKEPEGTVLDREMAERLKVELRPAQNLEGLEVIETPGHSAGSICLWHAKERILFSGDTLFSSKQTGRVDLPSSEPSKMNESLMRLVNYNFKILCPGHD